MEAPSAQVCLGNDIGGTNMRIALVSMSGAMLASQRWPTEIFRGRANLLQRPMRRQKEMRAVMRARSRQ